MNNPDAAPFTPADRKIRLRGLFYTAMGCFFIGLCFVIASVVIPLVRSDGKGFTWVYLVAMFLTPLGFLLALVYAVLSGRPPRNRSSQA